MFDVGAGEVVAEDEWELVRQDQLELTEAELLVQLVDAGRSHLHRATMDSMEAMLGELFVRVRRSALIRIGAIAWCEPYGRSSWVLVLRSGARIISSRYFMANLRRLFGETD